MSIYIGVDPGKSGAIAAIRHDGLPIGVVKLSETQRDIWDWLGGIATSDSFVMATIEKVASSPQMGVKSSFTFGESYGFLQGLLTACSVPFEFVTPNKWQTAMKCQTRGDKNVTKAAAQRLFPTVKITHANADALLIAEFTRRTGR